jgi:hypothetical protein
VSRGQSDGSSRPLIAVFSRPQPMLFLSSGSSVIPQRGRMDPVADSLILRKSDRGPGFDSDAEYVGRNSDH